MNIIIPADWIETGAIASYENFTGNDWDQIDDEERAQWLSDTDATLTAVVPLAAVLGWSKYDSEVSDHLPVVVRLIP